MFPGNQKDKNYFQYMHFCTYDSMFRVYILYLIAINHIDTYINF